MENTKALMKAIETTDFAIHGGILVWLLLRVYENYTWDNIIPLILFYIWVFVYHFIFYKISYKFDKTKKQLEDNVHTGVMLKQHSTEIAKLKKDLEKLKDATRDIKFSNGNGTH